MTIHQNRCVKLLIGLMISVLLVSNVFAFPNDPLSDSEIAKVARLTQQPVLSARATGEKGEGQNSLEVLLIEQHQDKNAPKGQRRADVYTYDYRTNELIETLVDLNTSEVLKTQRKKGVQLPLTEKEIKRAKEIVFNDEDERQVLAYEYHRITSRPLTDTTELNIKAFTFVADSLPNRTNEASKLCGIDRCAQLMLYTGDNIVFEVSPIVNLSEGIVTQRIGF